MKPVYDACMKHTCEQQFELQDLNVHVFPSLSLHAPVVYLHGLDGYSRDVLPLLEKEDLPDFSLVTVTVPYDRWSVILAPWSTPAGWPQYVACQKGAPAYLPVFLQEIVPEAERRLREPGARILAGYSLAGLFALWVMCRTPDFSRVAAASPSLWFPGFRNWFLQQSVPALPESIFLSCSEEEYNTDNEYLAPEKPALEAVERWCREHDVPAVFQLDPGDHYQDVLQRTATAIAWVLMHPAAGSTTRQSQR